MSSTPSEVQQALTLGADAAMLAPRTSRMSRTASRSTRHSVTYLKLPSCLFFSREMSSNMMTLVGQIRGQAEAQRADAKQREEAQRAEALAREQMLMQMKAETEAANQKREQMMAENEIKRQKMLVDTNAAVLKEKMQADLKKDLEFQQIQQKERDRAVAAQQKLRELTGQ